MIGKVSSQKTQMINAQTYGALTTKHTGAQKGLSPDPEDLSVIPRFSLQICSVLILATSFHQMVIQLLARGAAK